MHHLRKHETVPIEQENKTWLHLPELESEESELLLSELLSDDDDDSASVAAACWSAVFILGAFFRCSRRASL